MAEQDITDIVSNTPDGDASWGDDLRGAISTLATRQTAAQVTATVNAAVADLATIVQQNGTATGQTIFVRFDGDDAPAGLVKGDIVITEVP